MDGDLPLEVRSVCPFRLVADDDVAQLLREVTVSDTPAGQTLFDEGDPTTGVSAVVTGRVDVLRHGRTLASLGPGSVLGELSLFLPSAARTATATATSAVRLITWPATDLRARLERHESLATAVVADLASVLAARLDRRTTDLVELLDVVGRRLAVADLDRLRSRMAE